MFNIQHHCSIRICSNKKNQERHFDPDKVVESQTDWKINMQDTEGFGKSATSDWENEKVQKLDLCMRHAILPSTMT